MEEAKVEVVEKETIGQKIHEVKARHPKFFGALDNAKKVGIGVLIGAAGVGAFFYFKDNPVEEIVEDIAEAAE